MTSLIWIDYVVLVIIGISALISLFRGFVREALSLFGWILAIWASLSFCKALSVFLEGIISVPSVRIAAAFLIVFFGCLICIGIINYFAGKLITGTGLSGTDRMIGVVFGAVRGVMVVGLLVLLAGFTAVPQDAWWEQSMLLKHFEIIAIEIRGLLPADIASNIRY